MIHREPPSFKIVLCGIISFLSSKGLNSQCHFLGGVSHTVEHTRVPKIPERSGRIFITIFLITITIFIIIIGIIIIICIVITIANIILLKA